MSEIKYEQTVSGSSKPTDSNPLIKANSENSLRYQFGPTTTGARNWWLITLFLLGIVLLIASFAAFPLSSALLISVLVFKCIALVTFSTSIGMAIKAFFNAYYRVPSNQKNGEPYVFFMQRQFLTWMQDPVNKVTFFCGLAFFIVVVIALTCAFPGVGLVVPLISPTITAFGSLFAATGTFGGSLIFPTIFLGAAMMTAFDLLCRGLEAWFPAPDGNKAKKKLPSNSDSGEENKSLLDQGISMKNHKKERVKNKLFDYGSQPPTRSNVDKEPPASPAVK